MIHIFIFSGKLFDEHGWIRNRRVIHNIMSNNTSTLKSLFIKLASITTNNYLSNSINFESWIEKLCNTINRNNDTWMSQAWTLSENRGKEKNSWTKAEGKRKTLELRHINTGNAYIGYNLSVASVVWCVHAAFSKLDQICRAREPCCYT